MCGIWDRLMDAVVNAYDGNVQMIDSSIMCAHQHASGRKKSGGNRSVVGSSRQFPVHFANMPD
jgi:hypothetical protein